MLSNYRNSEKYLTNITQIANPTTIQATLYCGAEITTFPQLAHKNNPRAQNIEIIQPNGQRATSINTTSHTVEKLPITAYILDPRTSAGPSSPHMTSLPRVPQSYSHNIMQQSMTKADKK